MDKKKEFEFVIPKMKLNRNYNLELRGKIWLVGGAQIITSFLNQGAVDEIIISVIPILLGKGMPLFKNIENETKLELVKIVRYDQLVDLHYNVLK